MPTRTQPVPTDRTHGSLSHEDATLDSNLNFTDDEHNNIDKYRHTYTGIGDVGVMVGNDGYDGGGETRESDYSNNINNNTNYYNNETSYFDGNVNTGEMDDTDEFGRQILRQAREDEWAHERRNVGDGDSDGNGCRNGSGSDVALGRETHRRSAFRKARTHPGVFERLGRDIGIGEGNLQGERTRKRRRNGDLGGLDDIVDDDDGRNEVVVSGDSDASVSAARKPREWGRKGRRGNEWLRAIKMDDGVLPGYRDHVDVNGYLGEESIIQDDWNELDADGVMPIIEDSPLSKKGSRHTTPLALKLESTSLDKIRQWEMTDDLTFGSLITSTPAVPSRRKEQKNTMLDDIKRMEIENVKEMAITKSQLNKIQESSPEEERERMQKPSEYRLSKHQQGKNWKNRHRSKQEEQKEIPNSRYLQTDTLTSDNTRSHNKSPKRESRNSTSPIMVYKYSQAFSEVDRKTKAEAQLKSPKSNSRRQHDSHNLLRKLARATSNSPSPAAVLPVDAVANIQNSQRIEEIETNNDAKSVHAGRSTKKRSPLTKATTTVESAFKSALATPMKDLQEYNQQDRDTIKKYSQPNATNQMIVAKTPVITGAWIDTPAPYRSGPTYLPTPTPDPLYDEKRQPEKLEDQNGEDKRHVLYPSDERKYPRSALAAVIEKVKGARYKDPENAVVSLDEANNMDGYENDEEYNQFGDSTILSLEELISPLDDEQHTGTLTKLDEDTLRNLQLPTEPPRTKAEKQRYQELVTLKEMQSRLDAARTSIRDASRSIKRVEQQVETRDDSGGGRCSKCGCSGGGIGTRGLVIGNPWPLIKRSLTTTTTSESSGQERRRLSWLGWIVVPLLCWYLSEVVLRYDYVFKKTFPSYTYALSANCIQQPLLRSSTLCPPHGRLWR